MLNKLKQLREADEEGFTLIELLVVIVIIGILAAIALPIFLNQQKAAMAAAVKSDIKNTSLALETYRVQKGVYPTSNAELADANITLSDRGNYAASNNFLICLTNNVNRGYAIFAKSEGGDVMYYASSTGKLQEEKTLNWPDGMAVVCPVAGITPTGAGNYAAWAKSGTAWATWVK